MSSEAGAKTKLTYREYVLFPNDGRRHEIIDGDHYVNPAPGTYHQTLSRRIQFQIYQQLELAGQGQIFDAPTDVQLTESDIVQPDLVVVLEANRLAITPAKIKGIPDLVVEILSPGNPDYDRELKKQMYQRTGVPEYWIVDPEEHVIEQYVLAGKEYELRDRHAKAIVPTTLPGVEVDLSKVW